MGHHQKHITQMLPQYGLVDKIIHASGTGRGFHLPPITGRHGDGGRGLSNDFPDMPDRFHIVHARRFPIDQDHAVIPLPLPGLPHTDDALFAGKHEGRFNRHTAQQYRRMLTGSPVIAYDQHAHALGLFQGVLIPSVQRPLEQPERYVHEKRRPLSLLALHANGPVHQLDEAPDNGQAKP